MRILPLRSKPSLTILPIGFCRLAQMPLRLNWKRRRIHCVLGGTSPAARRARSAAGSQKRRGLDILHPIDVKMPLSSTLLEGGGQALIEPRLKRMREGELRQSSVLDLYRWLNSEACINDDRNMYLDLNAIADRQYAHSRALAVWYKRNLCIFSNIQQLAKAYRKIIVLYGAGHLTIFRDLINACDQMRLIDANDFLW